jgi:hypothetical protein
VCDDGYDACGCNDRCNDVISDLTLLLPNVSEMEDAVFVKTDDIVRLIFDLEE